MMRKAEKFSQMAQKIKRDKIKETQETWMSQFAETDQQRIYRSNIQDKYRDLNKQRKLNEMDNAQEEGEQVRQQRQIQYQRQAREQQFGIIDGQKIFLKGLDLELLKKQKAAEIKRKIQPDYTTRINEKIKLVQKVNKVGTNKLYRDMIQRIKNPTVTKLMPKIDQNTYYEFDTNWTFGQLKPRIITKQLARHHKNPSFPNISFSQIQQMVIIISHKQQEKINNEVQKQMIEQDEDDIFAEAAQQNNINIGKQLSFGVGDIDKIYENATKRPSSTDDPDLFQFQQAQKRKKLLMQDQQQDYYGAYWSTGPSLEQLKNLRKQGISYYQFEDPNRIKRNEKQKKVDYNKQYDKIQRIIAQKQGKNNK